MGPQALGFLLAHQQTVQVSALAPGLLLTSRAIIAVVSMATSWGMSRRVPWRATMTPVQPIEV